MSDWIEKHHKNVQKGRKGYNPDQPRVPAGDPRGGQWTSAGGLVTGATGVSQGAVDAAEANWVSIPTKWTIGISRVRIEPDSSFEADLRAAYDPQTAVIRISESCAGSKAVLFHELGHHADDAGEWRGSSGWRSVMNAWRATDFGKTRPADLKALGLRGYSFKNGDEFMADIFKVHMMGDESTKNALAQYLKVTSLEWVFEEE